MIFWITMIIVILVTITMMKASNNADKEEYTRREIGVKREPMESAFHRLNIIPSLKYYPSREEAYILDKEHKVIAYLTYREDRYIYKPTYYSLKGLIEVSIVIDGETVTNTSRSSQLGGALIGSALAGGTGAIIGGLSGKTSSKEEISKVYLKITTADQSESVKTITFLDSNKPILKSSSDFQKAFKIVSEWEGQLKVMIHKDNEEKINARHNSTNTGVSSIADEIKKIHSLLTDGIITEEEFQAQKKKLMS